MVAGTLDPSRPLLFSAYLLVSMTMMMLIVAGSESL